MPFTRVKVSPVPPHQPVQELNSAQFFQRKQWTDLTPYVQNLLDINHLVLDEEDDSGGGGGGDEVTQADLVALEEELKDYTDTAIDGIETSTTYQALGSDVATQGTLDFNSALFDVTNDAPNNRVRVGLNLPTLAPLSAKYVTLEADSTLTGERVLTAGTGITLTDNGAGSTVVIAASGSGDVVGPGSSTVDKVPVFADTTGKLIKQTPVGIDASGNIYTASIYTTGHISMSPGFTVDGVDVSTLAVPTFYEQYGDETSLTKNALAIGLGLKLDDAGDGTPVLSHNFTAGDNITLTTVGGEMTPTGPIQIDVTGLAPNNAEYLVSTASSGLSAERVLTAGTGISLTTGSGILTVAATGPTPVVAKVSGSPSSTSTSLADVAGLTFSVASGVTYKFRFDVAFQVSAVTTGIALSVNGPTAAPIVFRTEIPTTLTTSQVTFQRAWNAFTASSGNDSLSYNYATVEGTFTTSASGTLALRYATEVAASAVYILPSSVGILWAFP